ncbi:MAG: hypothetical protein NHB14_22245 [Desulfosporosinus sp.]|nr:hypothetical protein [Desulfosporosinus sp.]MDA8222166.1 hypothetical protein [Desulfitobacterium hafniense]
MKKFIGIKFSLIENSIIDHKEKPKYKFSYLDSLLLANYMNGSLYEKYGKHDPDFVPLHLMLRINLSVDNIDLIKHSMTNNIYAYWTNGCSEERHFVVDENVVINISLNVDKKEIWIKYTDKPTIRTKFEFT